METENIECPLPREGWQERVKCFGIGGLHLKGILPGCDLIEMFYPPRLPTPLSSSSSRPPIESCPYRVDPAGDGVFRFQVQENLVGESFRTRGCVCSPGIFISSHFIEIYRKEDSMSKMEFTDWGLVGCSIGLAATLILSPASDREIERGGMFLTGVCFGIGLIAISVSSYEEREKK